MTACIPLLANLQMLQQVMQQHNLDGWLLYDFRASNGPMYSMLGLGKNRPLTRRLFYWLPAKGKPQLIRHAIEAAGIETVEKEHSLYGDIKIFSSWQQLHAALGEILKNVNQVAMEVSPMATLPYLSCVDAGTVQLVESLGAKVVSSQLLLQEILARWDQAALDSHLKAARALDEETLQLFHWVHAKLQAQETINEWQVACHLKERLETRGMILDHAPIVGVDANSADPHYVPQVQSSKNLKVGQVLLVDVWCRANHNGSRYADICRMAYLGSTPTPKHQHVFQTVLEAQTAAIDFLKDRLSSRQPIAGFEMDQVARERLERAGFGPYFNHRLGHSIDFQDHGSGTHLDNYETRDDRYLMTRSCFSVEPGIYLPGEFGVRLESDVYIDASGQCHVTGGRQFQWYCLDPGTNIKLPSASSPHTLNL